VRLSQEQRSWLQAHAGVAFRLTPGQVAMLASALERQHFSFQEIGETVGLTRAAVSKSLRDLARRGIIVLRREGDNPTRSLHHAEPGIALQPLLLSAARRVAAG
jgi:predicted transcriptional regulator